MGAEFLGSFVKGFTDDLTATRERNAREAELQGQRDNKIFEALANSDDPDIRAAAVTGLLTQNHPARAWDKFYGRVSAHPAYETIKGLVANGHQPFMGEVERTGKTAEAQTRGQVGGRLAGAFGAAAAAGAPLSFEQKQRATMGALGAASSLRAMAKQKVLIKRATGETVGGFFDPDTGGFFDDNGQPLTDVVSYQNAAGSGSGAAARTGATGIGAAWTPMTMGQYRQMFAADSDLSQYAGIPDTAPIRARISADGSEASAPVLVSPPPANPNFNFIDRAEGVFAGDTHSGTLRPALGASGVRAPVNPATAATSMRNIVSDILRLHQPPKGIMPGIPPSRAAQAAWQAAVDQEAQRYGYPSFAALQAAVGDTTADVQRAVPPGSGARQTQPPPAAPGAPGAASPAQGRSGAQGAADPLSGNDPEFVNRVLRELQR